MGNWPVDRAANQPRERGQLQPAREGQNEQPVAPGRVRFGVAENPADERPLQRRLVRLALLVRIVKRDRLARGVIAFGDGAGGWFAGRVHCGDCKKPGAFVIRSAARASNPDAASRALPQRSKCDLAGSDKPMSKEICGPGRVGPAGGIGKSVPVGGGLRG